MNLKHKQKSILLIGTHGQNNIGDELLLETFLYQLRKEKPNTIFYVNSYKPDETSKTFRVVSFHTLKERFKLVNYIFKSDIILFAGGSILKELYSEYGRNKYSTLDMIKYLVLFSKYIARKKIIMSNIGIGPLSTQKGFKKSKNILNKLDLVSVRDQDSLKYGKKLTNNVNILKVPDAVFSLDRAYFEISDNNPKTNIKNIKNIKKISLNLCRNIGNPKNWDYFIKNLIINIKKIYEENSNIEIVGLPMQYNYSCDDYLTLLEFSKLLKKELPHLKFTLTRPKNVREVVKIINDSDILISERLHCAILATVLNKPFLPLEYDIKVTSYIKDIKLSRYGVKICENIPSNEIYKKVSSICNNYNQIVNYLNNISKKRKKTCDKYFSILRGNYL